jgi:hypothetical protein
MSLYGSKNDQLLSILALEKSRRFAFFLVRFLSFLSKMGSIRIYRKTAPTKSTVLGPGPPPGISIEIYRFLALFTILGAFNRAGKTVSKIGIYSKPPLKSDFYEVFYKFATQFRPVTIFLKYFYYQLVYKFTTHGFGIMLSSSIFWYALKSLDIVFLFTLLYLVSMVRCALLLSNTTP